MNERKRKQRIIQFHHEYPNRCICWLLKDQTIGWDECGNVYADDIEYYTKPCEECGYKKYDGPTEMVVAMAAS